ncbi:MAG: GNAT family N-acyltransferase [bacterium]
MPSQQRLAPLRLVRGSVGHAGTLMQWAMADAFRTHGQLALKPVGVDAVGTRYECRVISDRRELRKVFQLRYDVFRAEYGSPPSIFRLDVDGFDRHSIHLAVIDRTTRLPVGVYRVVAETSRMGFYSAREFALGPFLARPGVRLELGRACVHPEHRNGAVLRMLWKGLVDVARSQGADHMFGCSSVICPPTFERGAASVTLLGGLRQELDSLHALRPLQGVVPQKRYEMTRDMRHVWDVANAGEPLVSGASAIVPALLRSYIRAGAYVIAPPAYDREFRCLDLLTVFPLPPRA